MGKVVISPNIIKTSERIDMNGNVINPRTKQIITPREVEISPIPPLPEPLQAPVLAETTKDDGLSVLSEIEATKRKLAELEETKKKKIEETKKLLSELEK